MKRYFFYKAMMILFVICFITKVFAQIQNERKLIIGAWVTQKGSIKYVFTSEMKCYQYYKGKLSNLYSYKLSNNAIQCGQKVYVNKNEETSYLEFTNLKNGTKNCFEINGIGLKTLSLTGLGYSSPTLYTRQKNKWQGTSGRLYK